MSLKQLLPQQLLLLLLLLLVFNGAWAGPPDCAAVTAAYSEKGLDVLHVSSLMSGAHLRVCPQRPTCCSRSMEDALVAKARQELRLQVAGLVMPRASRLDSLLGELQRLQLDIIEAARRELDHNLKSIYGYSYLENKAPFTAFFDQLAAYVRGDRGSGPVSRVASDLFDAIAGRVYALTMNNYNLDRAYLSCAQRQFASLRPLGAMPDRVGAELLKAFVTGRSFLLGLASLAETLRGASVGLQLSDDCQRARLRAHYCAWCDGIVTAPACYNLCANVAAGCLASQAPLASTFDRLVAELERMTDLVEGASGVHMALRQLGFRISSGIMEMQERKDALQSQISSACSRPKPKTSVPVGGSAMSPSSGGASSSDSGTGAAETPAGEQARQTRLTQLVGSVRVELRALRGFFSWEQLVQKDCHLESRPDACWNGTAVASYLRNRRGTSGPDLVANPEVSVQEATLTRPAEPVATRLAELQMGLELASSLPKGGENYRTYRENTEGAQRLARLLQVRRDSPATAGVPGPPPLPPASSQLSAGLSSGRFASSGGSGSGSAPPPSPSATRRRPPSVEQPPPLVVSSLATTPPPPPHTPPSVPGSAETGGAVSGDGPPPPPQTPPPPPQTPPPLRTSVSPEFGGAGSGDRPPPPSPIGSGDTGPPPVPVLPDSHRTTERLWLPDSTTMEPTTTVPTTTPTTTTSTTPTTTTTTTTTTSTTTTTPTTTTTTAPTMSTAAPTPVRIDTGGSGVGQPDEEPDDLSTTEAPPLLPSSLSPDQPTQRPPGPAGSGDEEPSLPPAIQPTPRPPGPPPDSGSSGGEEPPSPPPQRPDLPSSIPSPQRPELPTLPPKPVQPPPDLWLPKEPDEQGGAEGRRGEGSVHEPMRMTSVKRGASSAVGRLSCSPSLLILAAAAAALATSSTVRSVLAAV